MRQRDVMIIVRMLAFSSIFSNFFYYILLHFLFVCVVCFVLVMSTASATKTEENAGGILLARQGRIKDVPYVLSNLFYDDVDDPILTRSKTWLRRNGRDGNSVTSVDVASTSRNDDDVDDGVKIALSANATVVALSRKSVVVVCAISRNGLDDDDDDDDRKGVVKMPSSHKNKDIRVRSLAFVDFANDAPFLLVGLSNGRLEGYDCVDIQRPQLLFSRKLSIEPLVSIRARPLGQRLGPKKKIEEDDGVLLEEDVTIFTEGGEVMRVDSVEIKSHLYRLRMIRKQYPHDFQPEKDDLNTLTGMVKFDGFKRIAPIRDGVCIGNVPLKCSEIGLREKRNGGLNMLFNNSDDSESDDRDKDEHDEEKFGFVACGKSALAFVQASGGSKFGAVEAVSLAAKKVFSFFAKKTKGIQKRRFDLNNDDDGDRDDNDGREEEEEEDCENKTPLKPSKWKSAIVDGPRKITNIHVSPDGSVIVGTDSLGRVTTYDCKYGNLTTTSMIKGCRDSDVGFVDEKDLVVLSPHRGGGVLEYFPARLAYTKPSQTEKELVVGRDSRIILPAPAFMGTLFNKLKPKYFNSYCLGPDGSLDRISVR